MLVPSFLVGTADEVRSNVRKAVTRLRRGEPLQAACEASPLVDLAREPTSLVWMDGVWVLRPRLARDFRAVALTKAIFFDARLPFALKNAIREESVEYLATTPWGTALMNSGQGGVWYTTLPVRPYRPSRRAYAAILEGTLGHWDALVALGARYYRGGADCVTFPGTLPNYGGILARLGFEVRGDGVAWRDIRAICAASVVEQIRTDDQYWEAFVTEQKRKHRTPDLVRDNLEQIRALCEGGSWDASQWEFLRRECGPDVVEDALKKVEQQGDLSRLLGVYVHALNDMKRAAALFLEHEREHPEVHWAAPCVAEYLDRTDPTGTISADSLVRRS